MKTIKELLCRTTQILRGNNLLEMVRCTRLLRKGGGGGGEGMNRAFKDGEDRESVFTLPSLMRPANGGFETVFGA